MQISMVYTGRALTAKFSLRLKRVTLSRADWIHEFPLVVTVQVRYLVTPAAGLIIWPFVLGLQVVFS